MAYSRRNWTETTAITPAELNRMEEGIDNIKIGTWKPSVKWGIQGGTSEEGGSWGTQENTGYWYRVGDLVFINATIYAKTKKSTGNLVIANLPFTPHATYNPASIGHFYGIKIADGYMVTSRLLQNKTIEFIRQAISTSADATDNTRNIQVSDIRFSDGSERFINISLSAVYRSLD